MAPGLCENCHKRPKSGTHRFCGKTCAAQGAANPVQPRQSQAQARAVPRNAGHQRAAPVAPKATQLCIQCGQNPKYNNFDYCGKSCAALANAARSKPPTTQSVPATVKHKAQTPNAAPNNSVRAPAPAKVYKTPQTKVPVPQDNSTEEDEDEEDEDAVSTDLDAYPSDSGSEPEDRPSVPAVAASQPNAKSTPRGVKPGSGVPKIPPGVCAIPVCGQPSHVDRNGVMTRYCSTKHREEAIKLGLEEACIMCQRYPQSTSDYFCSSACRNQSMTKT